MADRYDVAVKVISQKGTCAQEHKVGDEWVIGSKTPEGICVSALHSVYPHLCVLRVGGSLPWSTDPDACTEACPDPNNPVIFEFR